MTLYKFQVHSFIKWHLYALLYASHLTSTLLPSPRPPYPLILFYLNLNSHKWPVTSILNHTGEKSFHFQESRTRKINSNYRWENWNSEICSNWIGLNTWLSAPKLFQLRDFYRNLTSDLRASQERCSWLSPTLAPPLTRHVTLSPFLPLCWEGRGTNAHSGRFQKVWGTVSSNQR